LRYFKFVEFWQLIFGLCLDVLYKRVPRRLFFTKNLLEAIKKRGGNFTRHNQEVFVEVESSNYFLRVEGSDLDVFDQIVMRREFDRILELTKALNKSDVIVLDCGANIGLVTVQFKKSFPGYKIISLEPEKNNFNQLQKNIQANKFTDIISLPIGVWHEQ